MGADLVLLDLRVPQMDDYPVMTALRNALPADAFVPVVVLTADNNPVTRLRALRAGARDFLTKPFDTAEVTLRVRNLLETRALYMDVRRRNAALTADLAKRADEERRATEARRLMARRACRLDATRAAWLDVGAVTLGPSTGDGAIDLRLPPEWDR